MRLLARREHSVFELRQKLTERKFDCEIIERVLSELIELNYLSDERFVEVYVRGRFDRGIGPSRIQVELRERGIPGALVTGQLDEYAACWADSARRQRVKRFGEELPPDFQSRARQMRFLQQRGFTGEQIRTAFQHDPL